MDMKSHRTEPVYRNFYASCIITICFQSFNKKTNVDSSNKMTDGYIKLDVQED